MDVARRFVMRARPGSSALRKKILKRDPPYMTSTHRRGGGRKYPKFADKQYITFADRWGVREPNKRAMAL